MSESDTFYRRHRPSTYAGVIGQGAVVRSLKQVIADRTAQTFLFHGPSGTGKTTLARIAARQLGCDDATMIEINGATHTGVDAMRSTLEVLQYKPFGASQMRALIVDECHRLSGQAWDSLLKATEEPPEHVTWFFCTTNIGKVPATIKTRCTSYKLNAVSEADLTTLVERVCEIEKISLASGVLTLIIHQSNGSPRQALVNLSKTYTARDRKEAASLLQAVMDTDPIIQLCQFMLKSGGSFARAMEMLAKLDDVDPESVRIVCCNYVAAALKASKSNKDAVKLLTILDAFATSYNQSDGMAPLLISIGRVLFSDAD